MLIRCTVGVPLLFILNPLSTTLHTDEVVVIFDYEAQEDNELDMKVGDVIKDVVKVSHSTHYATILHLLTIV